MTAGPTSRAESLAAVILAAGRGTRLLPHTTRLAKPLFPVAGELLLGRALAQVRRAGARRIIVNCHHLAGQIRAYLAGATDVRLQHEETLLETGGGLGRAARSLAGGPVLVVNSDVFHTFDLQQVVAAHRRAGVQLTMVLRHDPRFARVRLAADGRIRSLAGDDPATCLAYTGIQVVERDVLLGLDPGRPAPLVPYYEERLQEGMAAQGLVWDHGLWQDVGTPARLLELHDTLARGREPVLWRHVGGEIGTGVRVASWAVVAAGGRVDDGAHLHRVVVLPGGRVAAGDRLADTVVGPGADD